MHLTFTEPLSGLAPLTEYELTAVAGAEGLHALRSSEDPGIRLFLVEPERYVPGYRPELPADAVAGRVLVVVTPAADGPTVNLVAPIVVDEEAGTARQVVIPGEELDRIRTPLGTAA